MKRQFVQHKVHLRRSNLTGHGVFAIAAINAGDIVEECRVLSFKDKPDEISDYCFTWKKEQSALPLGNGIFYNHADEPNAEYLHDEDNGVMVFKAKKDIKKNQEIFVSYGKEWFSTRKLGKLKPQVYRSYWWHTVLPGIACSLMLGIVIFAALYL